MRTSLIEELIQCNSECTVYTPENMYRLALAFGKVRASGRDVVPGVAVMNGVYAYYGLNTDVNPVDFARKSYDEIRATTLRYEKNYRSTALSFYSTYSCVENYWRYSDPKEFEALRKNVEQTLAQHLSKERHVSELRK